MAGIALGLLVHYSIAAVIGSAIGLLVLASIVYKGSELQRCCPRCLPLSRGWARRAWQIGSCTPRAIALRTLLRKSVEQYLPPP
jgi:hypothetical protein